MRHKPRVKSVGVDDGWRGRPGQPAWEENVVEDVAEDVGVEERGNSYVSLSHPRNSRFESSSSTFSTPKEIEEEKLVVVVVVVVVVAIIAVIVVVVVVVKEEEEEVEEEEKEEEE
ncbi:hypothetical protein M0802_006634 [Mischocyttarus mexicanus]|nr:hypothetical protein M0802_006634 [Mischocyttarus mexicanus]